MIDVPQTLDPDDPLAQPTRRRLFAELGAAGGPLTTGDLAARLALHPNGIRGHLARLREAGLVSRDRTLGSRGRPADAWTIAATARPAGRAPSAYEDLGRWLARAMRSPGGQSGLGVERTGREIGRELAGSASTLTGSLAALGFEPQVSARDHDRLALSLCNCPYRAAVRENQPDVCSLHRGITEGLIEVLSPGARLERFEPHDPELAGCEVVVSGLGAS